MAVDLTLLLVILDFFWTFAGLFVDMSIEDCLKKAFFHEKFENFQIFHTSSVRNSNMLEFLPGLLWLRGVPMLFKLYFDYYRNMLRRNFPVYDFLFLEITSGVPVATTRPPASPPSGPRSIM